MPQTYTANPSTGKLPTPSDQIAPGTLALIPGAPQTLPSPQQVTGWTMGQLELLWISAGGSVVWAPTMAAIAIAGESRGNAQAKNVNANGTYDLGLWQINSSHKPANMTDAQWTQFIENPYNNVVYAVDLFKPFANGQEALSSIWTDPTARLVANNKSPMSVLQAEQVVSNAGFASQAIDIFDASGLTGSAIMDLNQQAAKIADATIPVNPSTLGAATPGLNVQWGSLLGPLGTLISDVLDINWWKRVGQGAAGLALIIAGLVIFFVSTSDKKLLAAVPVPV